MFVCMFVYVYPTSYYNEYANEQVNLFKFVSLNNKYILPNTDNDYNDNCFSTTAPFKGF